VIELSQMKFATKRDLCN